MTFDLYINAQCHHCPSEHWTDIHYYYIGNSSTDGDEGTVGATD